MKASRISGIINYFFSKVDGQNFTLREFLSILKEKSFGLLLIIGALPNIFFMTIVPGFSFIAGTILIFASIQMILNLEEMWLPKIISQRKFDKKSLESILRRGEPFFIKIDRLLKPRWSFIMRLFSQKVLGILCLLHALLVALPIPMANFLCSVALMLLALGSIAKDGACVLVGVLCSLAIFYFFYSSFHLAVEFFQKMAS